MKKKIMALVLAMAMVVGATACGGADKAGSTKAGSDTTAVSESANGNTVVVAIGGGFDTLDPGQVYEKYPQMIINACYENLFKFYSNDGEAEPCLADTYELSEDGLTLTIKLKEDVTFASGNKLTSKDVVFSLNRTKNLKGNPSFIADTIGSVEAVDDYTVKINLTQPDSAITSKLCYSAMAILDSEVVKENGGTDEEDAAKKDSAQSYLDSTSAGSGKYILTSYTPDSEIVLEKNEKYWGESTNVDKYVIKIQDDANTQMMTLSSGDIDIAANMTADTMDELKGTDGIKLLNNTTKTVSFLMMNMDEKIGGPVSDTKVQQAIRYALDYKGIQKICGEGTTTPYSIIQAGFFGSLGERTTDYQDVDKAKELLKEAGYEKGFDIDLTVCDLAMEGIALTDLAQKVKSDLAEVGINVNIVSNAWAAGYGDDYRDGKLGFTVMYWGIDYNDPNVQLEFLPGGVVGLRAGWTAESDPEIAALYSKAVNALTTQEREAALKEVQEATYEYGPFIMLAQAACPMAYNDRLDNVEFSDPYTVDLTQVTVK
ncbi:peptide/nickel transport system substrate-binding protein [Acetitomaculum ruminis DSM 5522]|uniref:Peptide/nickel transport system substrate-binding protein n=1 Tax=Acetitomaculum ruminis DSM 5522 TaxID=1120918 RepID=A0A1I0ZZC2_9FIRM|nr:ABC transporter substrate-binding protein [Acetitomaculum ruminis]SFB29750.1 peptide/nickel transport system substrate-binding protein [Acetitomaculum ruminis DSM 5522]